MGGGGDSFITNEGSSTIKCDSSPAFTVIVYENQETISFTCEVNQEVRLEISQTNNELFPIILVKRISDNLTIGIVPPSYVWLLKCLEEGWEYAGKIRKISGVTSDPKISVILRSVKK